MTQERISETDEYLVCHNNIDIYHLVFAATGNYTITMLPIIDIYSTIEAAYAEHGEDLPPLAE